MLIKLIFPPLNNINLFCTGTYVRIAALIVKVEFRQNGVGKKLMESAEQWAKELGALTLLLNSGNRAERAAAHAFYLGMGYQIKSSGFVKELH